MTASVKCLGSPGCSERDRELLILKGSCGWKAGSLSGNHVDGDPHPAETDKRHLNSVWNPRAEPQPQRGMGKSRRLKLTLILAQQNEGQESEIQ